MVNILPIDVAEERLRHDFLGIGRSGTETQLGLAGEQFLENRDRIAGHVNGVERFVGKDGVVDVFLIFAAERRLLKKHLVYEDSEGPPIDGATVFFVE